MNGENQVPDMIVVDTDVLIDAGRGVEEAVSCLNRIEHQFFIRYFFRAHLSRVGPLDGSSPSRL
jgi:hypothetical protein